MPDKIDFQVKEITAEEWEVIKNLHEVTPKLVRVGPKGYLHPIKYVRMVSDIYNLELRPDDITVASFQRSGTTLTQELVWLIINDLNYDKAAAIPLTRRYNFLEVASFIDENIPNPVIENASAEAKKILQKLYIPAATVLPDVPSPRFIKTHLPMSLLPPKLVDKTKVVYVARDPRDVAVSSYHHARLMRHKTFKGSFKQYWNAFISDLFVMTPYFEHVKEAWALRNHPNMLFIFFEDILKDLPGSISLVATFLGKELTPAQVDRLHEHLKIDNFKKNKSVNYEDLREFGLLEKDETFIRQGEVGGWRDYFDAAMCAQAERWIVDNLRDTDLRYPTIP